jgi:hypothetical protein
MKTLTPVPVHDQKEMRAWQRSLSVPAQAEVKWLLVEALLTFIVNFLW